MSFDDKTKEFEGTIDFKVEIQTKNNSVNKKELESYFGVNKVFFFKEGKYKWLTKKGNTEFEIYNYDLDSLNTISKKSGNDTLYYNDFSIYDEKIISNDSIEKIEICGIKCQGIKVRMTNSRKMMITRTMYFPIESLKYSKNYYKNQKSMCNDLLYEYGGSIPLKLILDIDGVPYKMIYTAKKITQKKISDSEFEVNQNNPKKFK